MSGDISSKDIQVPREEEFKVFLKNLNESEFHRLRSWDSCFKFFSDPRFTIQDPQLLHVGGLQLGSYLASFGMFRGSKLGTIAISAFEKLVLNIFQNIEKSSNNSYKSIPLPELREIVKRSLKMAPFTEVSPTPTLISKIIMGVFCRTIAEDRYAKKGLQKFQEQNPKLHPLKGNIKSIDWDSISKCEPLAKRFATLTPTFFGTK